MNRDHVLFHLREASEELSRTISQIESDPAFSRGEFALPMLNLYHHLNTVWNTRSLDARQIAVATDRDLNAWGLFPVDLAILEARP